MRKEDMISDDEIERQYHLIFYEMMSLGLIREDETVNADQLMDIMDDNKLRLHCLEKYGLVWSIVNGGNGIRFGKALGKKKDKLIAEMYKHPMMMNWLERLERT
jgi:hypothetical protein